MKPLCIIPTLNPLKYLLPCLPQRTIATIKRDYVYNSDCKDARTVMKLFGMWIKDYNPVAPHSGLGMRGPVEYRKCMGLAVSLK